jgi:plastocyanin
MKATASPFSLFCRPALLLLASCSAAFAATIDVEVDPASAFHKFKPEVVNINPGDTVRWIWRGNFHTVTSGNPNTGEQNGIFSSPLRSAPYQFSYTFNTAGTFDYFCVPHREMGMIGKVIVGTPPSTPTPPPTPPPGGAAQPLNVSTRLRVQSGQNAMIGGFIVTGNAPKRVIVRAIGPSLGAAGVAGALADTVVDLNGPGGPIGANDNWKDNQQADIQATGVPPSNDLESAIVATLPPGNYTAIVEGKGQTTGVGLVEVYDLDQGADSKLANISTRGLVETGSNVMIGGFILGKGTEPGRVIVRAIGPALSQSGISGVLADPTLELRDGNGELVRSNNNWKDSQQADIQATGIPPQHDLEAAIIATVPPGPYTAIVAGNNGTTGVALVEVYHLQ